MIGIALSPEEKMKRDQMLAQQMAVAQSKGIPRITPQAGSQGPLGMIADRAKQEVAKEVATRAVGTAMGDPTGGEATSKAAEFAEPMLRDLFMKFFNKGGYVNGPLSKIYKY